MHNFIDYIEFWNDFVLTWYSLKKGLPIPTSRFSQDISNLLGYLTPYLTKKNPLTEEELPEPYLMHFPENKIDESQVRMVVFNLNPGGTAVWDQRAINNPYLQSDATKMLNPSTGPDGFLLNDWATHRSYAKYAQDWSPITHPYVVGGEWWCLKRLCWIRRFTTLLYGTPITPEQIWAMELCPYHSQSFNSRIVTRKTHNVLMNIDLDCLRVAEDTLHNLNKNRENPWYIGVGFSKAVEDLIKQSGNYTRIYSDTIGIRRYSLYQHNTKSVKILVTHYPRPGVDAPSAKESAFEVTNIIPKI